MIKQSIITIATLGLLTMGASAVNTAACVGCHGKDFEKKAMNVSKVVKDMAAADIEKALTGYKDGSYGGAMKGVMKGQVTKLSADDIKAIAASIAGGDAKEESKKEDANETKAAAAPAKEVNTAACAGCHGKDFEKKAMNVSKVVKDMTKADIEKALAGYKDGSYGGAMKGVMKGQVAKLSAEDMKAIADKFGK